MKIHDNVFIIYQRSKQTIRSRITCKECNCNGRYIFEEQKTTKEVIKTEIYDDEDGYIGKIDSSGEVVYGTGYGWIPESLIFKTQEEADTYLKGLQAT